MKITESTQFVPVVRTRGVELLPGDARRQMRPYLLPVRRAQPRSFSHVPYTIARGVPRNPSSRSIAQRFLRHYWHQSPLATNAEPSLALMSGGAVASSRLTVELFFSTRLASSRRKCR